MFKLTTCMYKINITYHQLTVECGLNLVEMKNIYEEINVYSVKHIKKVQFCTLVLSDIINLSVPSAKLFHFEHRKLMLAASIKIL